MSGPWFLMTCPRPLKMPDGVTGSLRRQQLFLAGWRTCSSVDSSSQDMVWVGTTESAQRTEKFASRLAESWQDWNQVCDLDEFATTSQADLVSFKQAVQAAINADDRGKCHDVVRFSAGSLNQKSA